MFPDPIIRVSLTARRLESKILDGDFKLGETITFISATKVDLGAVPSRLSWRSFKESGAVKKG